MCVCVCVCVYMCVKQKWSVLTECIAEHPCMHATYNLELVLQDYLLNTSVIELTQLNSFDNIHIHILANCTNLEFV